MNSLKLILIFLVATFISLQHNSIFAETMIDPQGLSQKPISISAEGQRFKFS